MADKKNIKLTLSYDGRRYHGWQRQDNATTIQAVMEEKIQVMTGERVSLIASGRTDAGVHAINQVCNFKTESRLDPLSIKRGLNSLLPDDIYIRDAEYVPLDFHSRYGAKSKIYEYRILNRDQPDIFSRNYIWHIKKELDLMKMEQCLSVLTGRHDFSSFKSSGSGNKNPVREMMSARLHGPDKDVLCLLFEADGFLKHMVRNMVGTIVDVGRGKTGINEFKGIFQAKDRRKAGMTAPPHGLFLFMVKY